MIQTNLTRILVVGTVAALTLFLAGCGSTDTATTTPEKSEKPVVESSTGSTVPAAYTNKDGELICPVMGTTIASKDDAIGYQDHDGKRYYFCCGGCPDQFKADPDKFANGANL